MNILIRKAQNNDFESVLRLSKALFDHEDRFGHEFNLNWTYGEKGQKYFLERFSDKNAIIFVAEVDGKVVGYIIGFIHAYSARRKNPFCDIENIFIEEKYRKQGLGDKLIKRIIGIAKRRRVTRLRLSTIAQNELAIKFYKSHGFEEVQLILEKKLK